MIAKSLGVSRRTAERALSLEKNADETLRKQIENNEITLNQAYEKLHDEKSKGERIRIRLSNAVSKIAWYVMAEMSDGFTAQMLLEDEDFKDALENPEAFEIPENDIQFLMGLGLKEIDLRGNNKKCTKKGRGIKNDSKE